LSSYFKEDGIQAVEYSDEQRHDRTIVGLFARRPRTRVSEEPSKADRTALYRRLTDIGAWPNLDGTVRIGPSGRSGEFNTQDPFALLDRLLRMGRFCVDTRAGKILHPGAHALRELSNRESLHVAVYGNRVRAHLDRVSPLTGKNPNKGHCRYSIAQVAAHVTGRFGARLVRELKGGWIKLDLSCSWMRMPQTNSEPRPQALEPLR
jgi:hypothetical protein